MRSRVMPGSFVTIERRVPVSRLNSVDFPTLGRPTITMDGSFELICVLFQPDGRRSSVSRSLASHRVSLTGCPSVFNIQRIGKPDVRSNGKVRFEETYSSRPPESPQRVTDLSHPNRAAAQRRIRYAAGKHPASCRRGRTRNSESHRIEN